MYMGWRWVASILSVLRYLFTGNRQQVVRDQPHSSFNHGACTPSFPPPLSHSLTLFFSFSHSINHPLTYYQFTCYVYCLLFVSWILTVSLVWFMHSCILSAWYHTWHVSCRSVNTCWTQFNQLTSLKSPGFWWGEGSFLSNVIGTLLFTVYIPTSFFLELTLFEGQAALQSPDVSSLRVSNSKTSGGFILHS